MLGEKFNGNNSAELFGLNIWTREDSWIPFDESFINPWIHNAKCSPLYGHPLCFSTLRNKMGKNNAIIAEWLLKTIRLSHDLYGWYTFDIKEIIPGFINGYDWSVQNTFKNNLFMDFIRNSPYRRIVVYVLSTAIRYNYRSRIFKGTDFYKITKTHKVEWQHLFNNMISHEEYIEIILRALEKAYIF